MILGNSILYFYPRYTKWYTSLPRFFNLKTNNVPMSSLCFNNKLSVIFEQLHSRSLCSNLRPSRHNEYPGIQVVEYKWQLLPQFPGNRTSRLGYHRVDLTLIGSQTLIALTIRYTKVNRNGLFTATYIHLGKLTRQVWNPKWLSDGPLRYFYHTKLPIVHMRKPIIFGILKTF